MVNNLVFPCHTDMNLIFNFKNRKMKNKISLPGFTAEFSPSKQKSQHYEMKSKVASKNIISPQFSWDEFKHDAKCFGCSIYPISQCTLTAGFSGNRETLLECVHKLAGGGCDDCISAGLDPRDQSSGPGGSVGAKGSFLISDTQATDLSTQIDGLRKQLNKIERCACPPAILTRYPGQSPMTYILRDTYSFSPQSPVPPSPFSINSY